VTAEQAAALLDAFRAGRTTRDDVLRAFQAAPVADLGFAQVDTHRALRKGFPEVIFGAGKTPAQIAAIAGKLVEREQNVLVTRLTPEAARLLKRKFKHAVWHATARAVTIEKKPLPKRPGFIGVLCAGTSDLPVAGEAAAAAHPNGDRGDGRVLAAEGFAGGDGGAAAGEDGETPKAALTSPEPIISPATITLIKASGQTSGNKPVNLRIGTDGLQPFHRLP